MRLGIADHFGWAVAVTASTDHEVVDRRRIELIEPGVPVAPMHNESKRLDVAATAALVAQVRASVARATSAALDELADALPEPIVSISLRTWPLDFPDDIAVQRRVPYEARADAIMYRQVLAEAAHVAAGTCASIARRKSKVRRSACCPSGPTRSCEALGHGWARPGRRTIGSRSPRPSSAAEACPPAPETDESKLATRLPVCRLSAAWPSQAFAVRDLRPLTGRPTPDAPYVPTPGAKKRARTREAQQWMHRRKQGRGRTTGGCAGWPPSSRRSCSRSLGLTSPATAAPSAAASVPAHDGVLAAVDLHGGVRARAPDRGRIRTGSRGPVRRRRTRERDASRAADPGRGAAGRHDAARR